MGRQHGYYSDDKMEAYHIDWAIETHADLWNTKINLKWFIAEPSEEDLKFIGDTFTKWNN